MSVCPTLFLTDGLFQGKKIENKKDIFGGKCKEKSLN
jgi:hypothetical protein